MTTDRHFPRSIVADLVFFGVAFSAANVVSYVYVVVVGRTLSPHEFGVFNALSGLITIAASLASSVQLAVTQVAARMPTRAALAGLMRRTARTALPIVAFVTLVAVPFASTIGAGSAQAVLCGLTMAAIFLASTAMGFVIGLSGSRPQAAVTLVGALARLASGWPLMLMGLGVSAAVLGYTVNFVVVLLVGTYLGWQRATPAPSPATTEGPPVRLEVSSVATFVLAFAPFTLDQMLVQAYAPALGGDYAALSTLAKLVFFAAYPITAVAYPRLLHRSGARSRARLVAVATAGVAVAAVILAFGLGRYPQQSMELFFGDRFHAATPYVGALAAGIACFSVALFGAHAMIACGSRIGYVPSLASVVVGACLFAVRHESLSAIVENMLWTYGLQLALMLALVATTVGRSLRRGAAPARVT